MPVDKQPEFKMSLPPTVSLFKEETYIRILNISGQKPSVNRLMKLLVRPEIIEYRVFSTNEGRSYEGLYLSGLVLSVTVNLKIKIIYTDTSTNQLVHVCDFESLKIMDVILPKNMEFEEINDILDTDSIIVTPYIEFSNVLKIDPKTLRQCGLLLVTVDLC